MQSTCSTQFDLASSGYPYFAYPIVGLLILGLVAYVILVRPRQRSLNKATALPAIGLAGVVCSVIFFCFYLPIRSYIQYQSLTAEMSEAHVGWVSGQVDNYRPFKSQAESFSVCGRPFSIRPGSLPSGYKLIESTGSPIRQGLPVKIGYVGNSIVHLEICPSDLKQACAVSRQK